jgi:transcriptional regulator with XRE-family HTH domain
MPSKNRNGANSRATAGPSRKSPKDRVGGKPKRQTPKAKPANCEPARIRVNDVKLHQLIILLKKGWTQKQCAAHFGVDVRTIYNWKNGREMQKHLENLGTKINPAVELGKFRVEFDTQRTSLQKMQLQAETEGEHTVFRGYSADLRRLAIEEMKILDLLNLFESHKFESHSDQDPAARQADYLLGQFDSLFTGLGDPEIGSDGAEEGESRDGEFRDGVGDDDEGDQDDD